MHNPEENLSELSCMYCRRELGDMLLYHENGTSSILVIGVGTSHITQRNLCMLGYAI